jgi:hypothetical protein
LETGELAACFVEGGYSLSANVISVWEGVIWLLVATVAELLPAVRPTKLLGCLHPLLIYIAVVRVFKPERYFCFLYILE